MTVYELIQELSRYNADTLVRFHISTTYETDVEVELDREGEDSASNTVTAEVEFNDDVIYDSIDDTWCPEEITINLKY